MRVQDLRDRVVGSVAMGRTSRATAVQAHRGTEGSNPFPSSGESATNSSGGPDQQSRHPDNCKGAGAPDQGARSPHGVDGGCGSPDTRSRRAEPFANDARGSIAVCAPGLTVSWTKRGYFGHRSGRRATCAKTSPSVTRFTLGSLGDGLSRGRATREGRAHIGRRQGGRRGLAPRPRDAAVRARVSKQRDRHPVLPDQTMLNLEDLGMSQVEPRRGPFAAIAAPASDGPVVRRRWIPSSTAPTG